MVYSGLEHIIVTFSKLCFSLAFESKILRVYKVYLFDGKKINYFAEIKVSGFGSIRQCVNLKVEQYDMTYSLYSALPF